MNTKRKEYKEYLRLQRELDELDSKYFKISSRNYFRYRTAIDYTEVKSEIRVDQRYYNKPIVEYLYPQDKDIIKLDLLNIKASKPWNKLTKLGCSDLFNFEIDYNQYKNLEPDLQYYFRVEKFTERKMLPTFKVVARKYSRYFTNAEGNEELEYYYIDTCEHDYEYVKVYRVFFKYHYPLKKASNKVIIERFDIFSDIQKAYDYLERKQWNLGRFGGIWTNSGWKKAAKKKSRAVIKQQLREIKDYDEDYDLAHKYHYPHNDKWFYD